MSRTVLYELFADVTPSRFAAFLFGASLVAIFQLGATSSYDYKPGEFLVIDHGKSPDKKLEIVAGHNKADEFGVYLQDAQTKKSIGRLEEVATGLDNAPDAFHAHWSPDSKHVGISSREDRHLLRNVIYRIEDRRAYVVETPALMCQAVPDFCKLQQELGGGLKLDDGNYYDAKWKVRQNQDASEIVKWISSTRFIVSEESQWQVKERDPTSVLGEYGKVEKSGNEGDEPGNVYHVWFGAEGECELLADDQSHVITTQPVKKSEKE